MLKMIYAKSEEKAAVVVYSAEFYQANKERFAAKSKAWREANKERAQANRKRHYEENKEHSLKYSRQYSLKRKFKITLEEYQQMEQNQGGVCAICGGVCTRKLAVDHDHATGKVRGLLCNNCNRGLGHFKDNLENLQQAINYLKEHSESGI